jgi:hypothetical protein
MIGYCQPRNWLFILSLVHFIKQDHGIGAFPQQLENKSPKMVGNCQRRNWLFILSPVHFIKKDHGIGAFPQQLENKSPLDLIHRLENKSPRWLSRNRLFFLNPFTDGINCRAVLRIRDILVQIRIRTSD